MTGGEDCLDGVDNDGDMLIDCADNECQPGFECVDSAPAGWEGYFRMNTTPFPNMAPSICPDGSQPVTYFDSPNGADCSACSCGGYAGASCNPPPLTCWDKSPFCLGGNDLDLTGLMPDGTCFAVPGIPGSDPRSCKLTGVASVGNPGACPASGGALLNPEPWANQDDVCGQPLPGGGGCAGSEVCVPKGGGDYNGPICIRKMGQDACPAGFQTAVEAATGAIDDRSCNACQCDVSGVTCAGGSYTVSDTDNCASPSVMINSMNCVNVTTEFDNNTGSIKASPPTPAGGSCTASGGEPSGGVNPQGIVTFCCQ
jgi:hypothetical protein